MSTECRRWWILAGIVLAYFVIFPDDLSAVVTPIKGVLELTSVISPWLYALLAAGIIAWAIVRCFERPREDREHDRLAHRTSETG